METYLASPDSNSGSVHTMQFVANTLHIELFLTRSVVGPQRCSDLTKAEATI